MGLTNADRRTSPLPSVPEAFALVKGKYRLLRLLGDGGMGSVYEALHEGLGVKVALKFLHPRLTRWPGLVQRFLDEARLAAPIRSPHVVQVLDVDQSEEGLAFIVLELLSGPTLRELLAERRLEEADARAFAAQLCDGLEAVHQAGIVHRDLKPENVVVTRGPSGEPLLKLLDFGIAMPDGVGLEATADADPRPALKARGSMSEAILGTPGYMAPEQMTAAGAVDARADLFSLGVLLFEMLTGRLPGDGSTSAELVPGIAKDLEAAIRRAMAPCPGDRFATASELRDALTPHGLPSQMWTPMTASLPAPSSAAGRVSRTSVEAPWFCVDPLPLPVTARGLRFEPVAPEGKAPEPSSSQRWRIGPAVALALTIGMALGGGAAASIPRGSSVGRQVPDGVFAAMMAAPRTAVEPDPAPIAAPPETALTEAQVELHQASSPGSILAGERAILGPGAAPVPSVRERGPRKPAPARAALPLPTQPSRHAAEPPARLPAPPREEIASLPDPWPGSRRTPPRAHAQPRDPRDSASPEIVILFPVRRPTTTPWPGRRSQVLR
jgi:serine/threonine protein kinase